MAYYIHPQETWDEKKCAQMAKRVFRDGLGTPGGPKGLINCDSSAYPRYGQSARYNGGCVRDDEWYEGETVPLPIIPDTYEFVQHTSWGTAIRKKI